MAVNSFNAQNPPVTTKGDVFTFSTIPTRLGVGANGTVLTADSAEATGLKWATPASGGGMTLLSTTNLTGASTTVSSINQTYNYLYIVIEDLSPAGNDWFIVRPNSATSNLRNISYSNASATQVSASSAWQMSQQRQVSAAETEGTVILQIFNYADTNGYKTASWVSSFYDQVAGADCVYFGYGIYTLTTAIDSIQFRFDSSNFDSGTVKIYGVK
jgi:hypothetical protein